MQRPRNALRIHTRRPHSAPTYCGRICSYLATRPTFAKGGGGCLLLSVMETISSSDLVQLLLGEVDSVSSADSLSVTVDFLCQLGGAQIADEMLFLGMSMRKFLEEISM